MSHQVNNGKGDSYFKVIIGSHCDRRLDRRDGPTRQSQSTRFYGNCSHLVITAVGPGETAEFHWLPQANQGDPQVPILTPREDITFTIVVRNVGDSSCPSEVVTTTVESLSGLNTLVVKKNGEKLTI